MPLISVATAFLVASCRPGEVVWPAATQEDLADTVYGARAVGTGAEVLAVSASEGVKELGLRCDPQSEVTLSPDGRLLYYGRDNSLYERELATAKDRVVAAFTGGVACETGPDETGRVKTSAWRCGARFRDLTFGPDGQLAFLVEPTETPLPEAAAASAEAAGQPRPRADFRMDAGAYLLDPESDVPRYLLPTRAVYGFPGQGALILESGLTAARYEFRSRAVTRLLGPEAHELGWLPPAAASGDKVVVVAPKADEKSHEYVLNEVYVIEGERGGSRPSLSIRGKEPATRVALSPDGRYLAVECTSRVLGEAVIYAVDLERKRYKVLLRGGGLLRFARGSRAVFYLVGRGQTGDLFLAGLDGATRRLTSDEKVLPRP
ncbi:MAG: hypothetical protein GTN49_13105 [candidate division Zixibacteria bacterium]|nr:hypothetical protein [candidate division Zixibacteria bacterium]